MRKSLPKLANMSTEEDGVAVIASTVSRPFERNGLGWLFRRTPNADVGIDGHIEITDTDGGDTLATGRLLAVQIKAGESWFRRHNAESWLVRIREETVNYWKANSLPVILILVDLQSNKCYWARGDAEHERRGNMYQVIVPKGNVLGPYSQDDLTEIANEVSKFGGRFASLKAYEPIMRLIQNGSMVQLEVVRYSGTPDDIAQAVLSLPDEPDVDDVELYWDFRAGATSVDVLLPWADLTPIETTNDPYDEYLEEEGFWDKEDQQYYIYSPVTYEEWKEARTLPDGFVMANGIEMPDGGLKYECAWEVALGDLGHAFLEIVDYLDN